MNAIEFLQKLKWTGKDLGKYSLVILNSGETNRREISCKDIELGRTFFATKTTRIPSHRILEIKKDREVVWSRRSRP